MSYSFSVPDVPGEEVRYCWVDEDGERMSPIHADIGKALSFCADWQFKHDRLERQASEAAEAVKDAQSHATVRGDVLDERTLRRYEQETEKFQQLRDKLTPTGKPPTALKRMVVRATIEDPNELERQMAELELVKIA